MKSIPRLLALCGACLFASPTNLSAQLLNGSFENGAGTAIDDWTAAGTVIGYTEDANWDATQGSRMALFNAGGNSFSGQLTQTLTLEAGVTYTLSLDIGIYNGTTSTSRSQRLGVVLSQGATNHVAQVVTVSSSTPGSSYVSRTYVFTPTVTGAASLLLSDESEGVSTVAPSSDLLVDNVVLTGGGSGNTAPVAVANSYSTDEDTPLVIAAPGLLSNDTDANSDPLTALKVADPANGTVTVNSNGGFTYTPNANFSGSDSFTYKANDGLADSNVATVTITVNAVADAPVAVADAYSVATGGTLTVAAPGVLGNDSDVDSPSITAVLVADVSHGTLTLNSNGGFTYTPTSGYSGSDSFTYKASDGTLESAVVTVSISVGAAVEEQLANRSFELGAVIVEANPSVPGSPGSVTALDSWGGSGARFGFIGTTAYPPTDGSRLVVFNGGYNGGSSSYTGTLTQTFGTVPGQTYTVSLEAGIIAATSGTKNQRLEVKVDGASTLLTQQVLLTTSVVGTVQWKAGGASFTFVADGNTATLTLRDNSTGLTGNTNSDMVVDEISVTGPSPVNSAPAALADSYSTNEDTPLVVAAAGVLSNDTDADLDPLTAVEVSGPSNGTLSLNSNGGFTYTPAANFNGTDSFTYKANDGVADSDPVAVSITVNPVNDAPVAVDDSYFTTEGNPLVIAAPGLLGNDTDIDGPSLNAVKVTDPSNGSVTVNANGGFTYAPNPGYTGTDSFTYKANDGTADSNVATVSITVEGLPSELVTNGSFELGSVIVEANPSVPGSPGSVTALSGWTASGACFGFIGNTAYPPTDGSRLLVFNGGYNGGSNTYTGLVTQNLVTIPGQTYTLNLDAGIYASTSGTKNQRLEVKLANSSGVSIVTQQVPLTTAVVGTAWKAGGVSITFTATTTTTALSLRDNGTGVSGIANSDMVVDNVRVAPLITRTLAVSSTPSTGVAITVSPADNSSASNGVTNFTRTYNQGVVVTLTAPTTSGALSFVKWRQNGVDFTTDPAAVVTMNASHTLEAVYSDNDAPVAVADSYSTNESTELVIAAPGLLANDSDADLDPLTAVVVDSPAHGTLSLNPDGGFTYDPTPGFTGPDTFTYRAYDGLSYSGTATVTITVNAVASGTLVNGSFELGSPANGGSLTGWTVSAGNPFGYVPDGSYPANVPDGIRLLVLNGGGNTFTGVLSQEFATTADQAYALSLNAGVFSGGVSGKKQRLRIRVESIPAVGSPVLLLFQEETFTSTTGVASLVPRSYTFVAGSGTTRLTIEDASSAISPSTQASLSDLLVDNVRVTAQLTRALTVQSTPNTGIPVTVSPSDLSGNAGANTNFTRFYNNGASVTLTAPASSGASVFLKWQKDGLDLTNSTSATVTMDASQTLTAVYQLSTIPVAGADSYSTQEDTQLSVLAPGVLGNDADPNSLPLSAVVETPPANGTLTLASDGSFTYLPAPDFHGADSFTYRASNGSEQSAPATVNLTVSPVNDAPLATDQSLSTDEDQAVAVTLAGTDADGDTLSFTLASFPVNGVLSGTVPNLTYTPNGDFNGVDSFTFTVSDGSAISPAATVLIDVTALADTPVANAQSVTVTGGTSAPITLTATDADGDTLTYTVVSGPTQGTLSGTAPNLTYTPLETYVGADSFTFVAADASSSSAPATVSITVNSALLNGSFEIVSGTSPNFTPDFWTVTSSNATAPAYQIKTTPTPRDGTRLAAFNTGNVAANAVFTQTFSTTPGRPYTLRFDLGLQNFTTSSHTQRMRVKLTGSSSLLSQQETVSGAGGGAVNWVTRTFSFTPNSTTTTLEFRDESTVTSNVDMLLDKVSVTPEITRLLTLESTPDSGVSVTVSPADISGGTNGVTGFSRRYLNGATVSLSVPATSGTANFQKWQRNGVDFATTRNTTVTMNAAYTMTAVYLPNQAPLVGADSYSTNEDVPLVVNAPGVLSNDSDPEALPITAVLDIGPTNGSVVLNPNGSFTYTPTANFSGTDTFTYRATDSVVQSEITTVTITVNPVNDAPVATAQTVTVAEDGSVNITLAGTDVEGSTLTYSVGTPTSGTLSGTAPNLTYTPNANFAGSDSFTFTVNDGTVDSTPATVSITVTPVNDAPLANGQSVEVTEDTPTPILLGASDIDGNSLTYTVGTPTSGTLSGTAPNLTYTPNENFSGSDSFTFTVNDGTVDSAPATVSITVNAVNDTPVATAQSVTVAEEGSVNITLAGTDVEGATLTFTVGTPTSGTLSGTAPNLTYTPNANFSGSDSFTFTVNDGTVDSTPATVSITVTPVNDAPLANGQSVDVTEDTPTPILLGASDIDGDSLTYTVGTPTSGTLSGTAPNLTYTPNANFSGSDSFTFTVNDGTVDSAPATVSITVNAVNDTPVATAQSVTVAEEGSVEITLAGTDVEGSSLTFTVGTPTSGTLSGTAPNLTYTPNANFAGSDSFTFTVNDGTVDSAPATVSITVTPVNDAPVANAQSVEVTEDTPTPIVLGASDTDGDSLTYTVGTPTSGTLSGTAPNLTYTPNSNFNGSDSFTFTVNDGTVDSAPATVSITVNAVNDTPVATAQSVTTDEDTAVNITLAGTDVEGSTLTFSVGTPTSGTLSGTAPNLTYTPNSNFSGSDSFTFTVNDGTVDSAPATVSITINAVNDTPVATAQSVTTDEGTAVNITLAGTDVEGSTLTYSVGTSTSGTLSGTAPNLTYTPNANFSGSDSFTFTVNDGTVDSAPATVSITVNAVNDTPVATAQSVTTDEDTAVNITLAGSDVEGATLTYSVGTPTSGTLTGTAPNLTYTPNSNFSGSDSFTFTVNDGTVDSAPATVSITVNAVNDTPVATAQSVTTDEDTALNITLAGSDVEGATLTYAVATPPTSGTLSGTAPNLTYTPNANFSGSDSFTFTVNDGTVDSAPATVSITVNAVNDTPVATAQSVTTDEDTALNITLAGSDVEGATLTYAVATPPTSGTLSGTAPNLTYTPNANFSGSDSFTFTVNDGTVDSAPATVSITVNAVNDTPVATAQSVTTDEDTAVNITLAGTDVEGSTLTYAVATPPTSGTLSGTAPNLTYTPNANFAGSDSFTFTVNDGTVDSAPATVSITVTPVNDAPVANAQSVDVTEDTPTPIVLGASDIDGDSLTYTVGTPTNGTLTGTAPNLTYTPNANFSGSDSFTFTVNDGTVDSAPATVSITVNAVNDTPVATAQSVTTDEDTALNITLAGTDVEGSTLTFSVGTPTSGTLSGTAPNLTYTPNSNFSGSDSFTFTVNDGTVDSAPATVSITVNAVNDTPVATAQSVTTDEDTAVNITLAGTDVEGSTLTFSVGTPTSGTLSGTAPNLTYTPNANFSGSDSFTFTVNDGTVDSAPATVSITVNAVNDTPVATAQSVTTDEDTALNITLAGSDVEGATLTYAVATPPTSGTLSGTAPDLTYTPNANYSGSDSFTFTVNDGTATSSPATVSITVTPVNDTPVATAQSVTTDEDTAVNITLAGTDVEGSTLTFSVGTPTSGTLSGTAPNLTYTPNANFSGSDSFTFTVNDGTVDSAPATVSITVNAVNDTPVATAQSVTTDENIAVNITLTGTDVEGSTLSFTVVNPPSNGALSGTAPNLTYTPAPNFDGGDSFTFIVNDGTADSAPATVSITVNNVSTPGFNEWLAEYGLVSTPSADPDFDSIRNSVEYVIGGNPANQSNTNLLPTVASVLADPDGDLTSSNYVLYTYRRTDRAKNDPNTTIRVEWNDDFSGPWTNAAGSPGVVVLEDNDHFAAGVDRVRVYLPRTLTPNGQFFVRLNVLIDVPSTNQPPVANAQALSVDEDGSLPITLTGTDPNGDPLTYTVTTPPSHGTLGGTAPNLTYTPNANYNGPDSFAFKVNDGLADSAPATVSITVNAKEEFNQWLAGFGITDGPGADSDNDSIPNSIEYVIGGNPANQNNAAFLPTVQLVTADPDNNSVSSDYVLYTYRRTDLANSDPSTSIRVEWNTGLTGAWTVANGSHGEVIVVENDAAGAGIDLVKVYIPRPVTGGLFTRLVATVGAP